MEEHEILYVDPKIPAELKKALNKFMDRQDRLAEHISEDAEFEKQSREWLYELLLPDLLVPLDIRLWKYYYDRSSNIKLLFEEKRNASNFITIDSKELKSKISWMFLFPKVVQTGLFSYGRKAREEFRKKLNDMIISGEVRLQPLKKESKSVKEKLAEILTQCLRELNSNRPNKPIKQKDIHDWLGGGPRQTWGSRIAKHFRWDKENQIFRDKDTGEPI